MEGRTRSAALVLLLSLALVVEGISRINLFIGTPSSAWAGDYHTYPPAVELAASVGLTFFGLAGAANGLYVLLLGNGSSLVTFCMLAVEFPLGWFFFSVFVLSAYPFMVARAAGPMPGFTSTQSDAIIMMGYLGAFGVGVPILAGHFYFMLQLARIQGGKAQVYSARYSWSRVYFYAALIFLRGIGEVAVGSIVTHTLGSGKLAKSIPDVPFIITWGPISIADGALVLLVSILAVVIAVAQVKRLSIPFAVLSFCVFVVQLALYATTQIGLNPGNALIVGSILVVDSFVALFMPAYLILEAARIGNFSVDEDISASEMPVEKRMQESLGQVV